MKKKSNLITDSQKLANLFNAYFINITDTSQLKNVTLKIEDATIVPSAEEHVVLGITIDS